ncbi:MAG: hypothetical protein P1P76_09070, partial [Anaerolineales bacterium]|nr:hypothetical protein [Anaerolineales bacterium]
ASGRMDGGKEKMIGLSSHWMQIMLRACNLETIRLWCFMADRFLMSRTMFFKEACSLLADTYSLYNPRTENI